jgi:uncharacterized membrane protein SpoIIM required for sporulation
MNETDFVKSGSDDWMRLRFLATKIEASPTRTDAAELEEFLNLYRKTSADLARARAETSNPELIESLNSVLGIAYSALYRRPRRGFRHSLHSVLLAGARAFRRQFACIMLSLLTVAGSTFFAAGVLHYRPDLRSYIVAPESEELFEHWREADFEQRTTGQHILMSGFYASNNPRVAVSMAAIGASTFGLGSFYALTQNGILLGALAQDMARVGKLDFLTTSLAPHGASELSGMIVSGAAGYSLGWALIAPGRRRRLDSLRERGKDALVLLAMGVLMMYIAAPFEGFFSFNPLIPQWLKAIVGVLVFTGWCAYWGLYGRKDDALTSEEPEMLELEVELPQVSRRSSAASDSA